MSARKTNRSFDLVLIGCLTIFSLSVAAPASAQILYAVLEANAELRILDPSDASTLETLGTIDHPNVQLGRGIALHPTTGALYSIIQVNTGVIWRFGTLDSTASFTEIAALAHAIRDLAFDSTGKLWAVTGLMGPDGDSLVSIDTNTGAVTLENGALPTTGRNKIAYVAETDTLYLLGDTIGQWELYSFSPSSPMSLTQVPLSGVELDDTSEPPMIYDSAAEVLRTLDTNSNWTAITLSGVVTTEAPFPGYNIGGLAFDTPIFADGFESGDTSSW